MSPVMTRTLLMTRTFGVVLLLAGLSYIWQTIPERLPVFLLSNGYLLATLLVHIRKQLPLILIAAFLGHLLAGVFLSVPFPVALAFALASVISSYFGAELIRPADGTRMTMRSLQETTQLLLNAGLVSSVLCTLIMLPAYIYYYMPVSVVMSGFLFFSAQLLSVLLVTPVMLTWKSSLYSWKHWQGMLESFLLFLATGVAQLFIYYHLPLLRPQALPMPIMAAPFVLWAVVRSTHFDVSVVMLIIAVALRLEAIYNPSLFTSLGDSVTSRFYLLNTHLILSAITVHFLAALLNERRELAELEHAAHEQLMQLNHVVNQLASTSDFMGFCRRCVELGREHLGFDRISIWLYDREKRVMRGAFGTDEIGIVRDERDKSYLLDYTWFQEQLQRDQHGFLYEPAAPIHNDKSEVIGQGEVATAILWDGTRGLGSLTVDNYLSKRAITSAQQRLVQLYATSIGHLCARIRVEEALQVSTQRLQEQSDILSQTQETARIGGWIYYLDTENLYWTPELFRIVEKENDSPFLLLDTMLEMVLSPERESLRDSLEQAKQYGRGWDFEAQLITQTGRKMWVRTQGMLDTEPSGVRRIYGSFQDISERKQLEHEMEQLFILSQDIFMLLDTTGHILRVNPAGVRISGYTEQEMLQKQVQDLLDPQDGSAIQQAAQHFFESGNLFNIDARLICRDGSIRWLQWRSTPLIEGRVFYAVARDITEQRSAETILKESETRFRDVTEAAGEYIWELDVESRYTFLTERVSTIMGYMREELLGQRPRDFMPENEVKRVQEWFQPYLDARLPFRDLEHQSITKAGNIITQSINGVPRFDEQGNFLGYRGTGLDITANKTLQEQVYQAQKMESVGRLAGGVAHDFNNLLTAIRGYTEMVADNLAPNHPAQRYLQNVEIASERATRLTGQLLAFARRQLIEPRVVDLRLLMNDIRDIIARLIGEDIRTSLHADADLWKVKIDPGQFEQIVVNLAVNARDAMPNGGRLSFSLFNRTITTTEAVVTSHEITPGDYVHFMVQDTGTGMDEATRLHIFEPFFTTKALGRGTGLGMATVHGIVKQHEGYIWVQTDLGHGTTFHIYMPRIQAPITVEVHEELLPLQGGKETILLVEDEAQVREIATQALEQNGYTVLAASNGAEALQVFQGYTLQIDLILTDVIMPEMSGRQLVESVQAFCPTIKVLYTSGYTGDVLDKQQIIAEGIAFLSKPYTPNMLARKVRTILDEASQE